MKAIYGIVNKINGHKYVGSAVNFYKRKSLHLRQLKKENHHSDYLQRAWTKYGEDNFEFIILEKVDKKEDLLIREQWWIDNSNSEYNVCKVAGSSLGVKRSDETKEKCRLAHLGEKHPEWRRKLKSEAQGGEKHWQYGKKMPDEVKQKKSESMKKYFESNKHPNLKPVLKYGKDGTFISEHSSVIEAAGYDESVRKAITNCLTGRQKTAKGYIWKYKNQ
jgi:group I intron endonuclease